MDSAELWLKENDPDFNYHRRKRLDYPFQTERQEREVDEDEIPVSNLWSVRKRKNVKDYEAIGVIKKFE